MSKLLANRWFRWTLLTIALSGLGVGICRFTPQEPRWSVEFGPTVPHILAVDGTRVVALPMPHGPLANGELIESPLRMWDTRTGTAVEIHIARAPGAYRPVMSMDSRWFAAEASSIVFRGGRMAVKGESLILIDIAAQNRMEIPLEDTSLETFLIFSPQGDLLLRGHVNGSETIWIYDTTNGKLVHRRPSAGIACYADFMDDIIIHYVATKSSSYHLEIWNPRDGKSLAVLENVCRYGARSPDGRFFVAERCTPAGDSTGKYVLWNLKTFQVEGEFQTDDGLQRGAQYFSPDGRWLAAFCHGKAASQIELREVPSGRFVGKVHDILPSFTFTPDNRFLVLDNQGPSQRIVLGLPSLKILWKRDDIDFHPTMGFSRDMSAAFAPHENGIHAYEMETGKFRAQIRLDASPNHMRFTSDRRVLCAYHWNENRSNWLDRIPWISRIGKRSSGGVVVLDTDAFRERFRLIGGNMTGANLSDDGNTLVTTHNEGGGYVIRCWDVNAWKPLHWALGVPAGMTLLIGLFAWWRGRRGVKAA